MSTELKPQTNAESGEGTVEERIPADTNADETTKYAEQATLGGPTEEEERMLRSRHLLLYVASVIVVLIVFSATILPEFVDGSEFLYDTGVLTILYATLSLAAAMITFGVIGDSGALIRLNNVSGTVIQIGGSAAGFAIFYYLLSSGLNPYKDLEVYLYKAQGQLMRPTDGAFEVTLASRISQTNETSSGRAQFSIPRSERNIRLFVNSVSGQLWELTSMSPEACIDEGNRISVTCDSIDAHLVKGQACLSDFSLSSYETEPIDTTLYIVLDTLKENLQNISVDLPVNLKFSDSVLEHGYHKDNFPLERKNQSARSVCEHLAAIENGFNWSKGKREVRTYLSCNTMLVQLANEDVQEEFNSCL